MHNISAGASERTFSLFSRDALNAISITDDGVGLGDFSIHSGDSGFQSVPLFSIRMYSV